MGGDEILNQLAVVIGKVFDFDAPVTRATRAEDVPGWDSLNNIRFFLAVEKSLGVRFDAAEIADLPDLGALVDLIQQKQDAG